jgi:hypothetical protein
MNPRKEQAAVAAGLVGHIREEQLDPSARQIRDAASSSIPYKGN